jgi:TonB family protein
MSLTQIPPLTPTSQAPAEPQQLDLYDVQRWESAYSELHAVPALLIQLQDDLARSRKREAFWISLVIHLILLIIIVNLERLEKYLPKRAVVVATPNDLLKQKDMTYLELPPDAQKITKRKETNVISDKDRIATSRTPQLDRKELKKLLDSSRPGHKGPSAPAAQPTPAQQPQTAQSAPAPQEKQSEAQPPAPQRDNQTAKLETPPVSPPKTFGSGNMSAGSAIEQATEAAAAHRGGYAGDNGEFGLGQGRKATKAVGQLDVLSDTMGVDFGPYLQRVLHDVKENWYRIIPESARAPLMKKGKVSIEFAITKDGRVAGLQYVSSSGDVALDRAAYGGITASNPFPPLPAKFSGKYLALRFHFFYNPDSADLQ